MPISPLSDGRLREVRARLARIVVAIDPAVTESDKSDETGIVVAGLGWDRCGYVLADLSGRLSPDAWARRAVRAYHEVQADRIVAEVNQGGAMVERCVRTIDPRVAYKAVRATRGKAVRAEPIAALYEQGRVFHVRPLLELEEQMCSWNPLNPGEKSPDRLDALVWALSELFLEAHFAPRNLTHLPPG